MSPAGQLLLGLPPVVDARTRVLILGSFPGAASLAAGQYYAHPRNQFWKILQAIYVNRARGLGDSSYQIRIDSLADLGLGLWDVYAACQRQGSLDSEIRQAEPNPLPALLTQWPGIVGLAHNGATSHGAWPWPEGLRRVRLPSSSPAMARLNLPQKAWLWHQGLVALGGAPPPWSATVPPLPSTAMNSFSESGAP